MILRAITRRASSSIVSQCRTTVGGAIDRNLPGAWLKTYEAKNAQELNEAYAAWAATYDADSIDTFG